MTETQVSIDPKRLNRVMAKSLQKGAHTNLRDGMCVMEAVAYVAGEPWADHPQCACPIITGFMISWNDSLPSDADRDRLLKPLVPRLVGTRSTPQVEERRGYLALDWLIRVHTPKFLELVPSLAEHAHALRNLPEIVDIAGATAAGERVKRASEASAAAWDAASAAAWDAARAAARAAAWDAAWDAARAAASAAASAAAWAAASAAARAKTSEVLAPTVEWLQTSAVALVERMIDVKPAS